MAEIFSTYLYITDKYIICLMKFKNFLWVFLLFLMIWYSVLFSEWYLGTYWKFLVKFFHQKWKTLIRSSDISGNTEIVLNHYNCYDIYKNVLHAQFCDRRSPIFKDQLWSMLQVFQKTQWFARFAKVHIYILKHLPKYSKIFILPRKHTLLMSSHAPPT